MQRRLEVKKKRGMIFTIFAYQRNREVQVSEIG